MGDASRCCEWIATGTSSAPPKLARLVRYSARQEAVVQDALAAAGDDAPTGLPFTWMLRRLLGGVALLCCAGVALSVVVSSCNSKDGQGRQVRDIESFTQAQYELGPDDDEEELPLLPLLQCD